MKIIDRYILIEFLTPLLYCFSAFVLIFIIGDLFENLDGFIINKVSWSIVVKYYIFMIPNVFVLTTPLTILLSILYQLGYMSRHNELTALKASGINFFRIVLPFGVIAVVVGILLFTVNERLSPYCARRINLIFENYLEKDNQKENKDINKNITFFSNLYNLSFYVDSISKDTAEGVSIREFNKDGSIKREWYGKKAVWADSSWWLFDGYIRQYENAKERSGDMNFFKKQECSINIPPKDLMRIQKYKDSIYNYMDSKELYNYMKRNFTSQNVPRELLVELYRKLSIPVIIVVVAVFGITFGAKISKGGALASVGYSLVFYISYYGISSFFLAMGKLGRLIPFVSVWTPHILFGIISVYLLRKAR